MRVNPEILNHEFIGVKAKIRKSTDVGYVGLSGKVVDETRNTFTLLGATGRKMVTKALTTFSFTFQDSTVVEIEGRLLVGRPEDRVKKSIRRLW